MKKLLLLIFLASCSLTISAQQDAQYSLYQFNGLLINPGYAGSKEITSATALYRHQWAGFEGAPRTLSVSVHGLVREKYGLGIFIENDQIGISNRTNVFAQYAYRFQLTNGGILSAGIQAGLMSYSADFTALDTDEIDEVFAQDLNKLQPNFGLGLHYYTDNYYVGLSAPHLLQTKFNDSNTVENFLNRHYLLTAGVLIPLNYNVMLRPSFLLKTVPSHAPITMDVTLAAIFYDRFWVGVSHRFKDSVDFALQYELASGIRFGYSYDFPISAINKVSSGSHELMLGYDFSRKVGKVITPRYF